MTIERASSGSCAGPGRRSCTPPSCVPSSRPRRMPGDEAIVLPDGTIEGFVGGQCAQNSVRARRRWARCRSDESVLLRVLPDGELHFPDAPGACVVVNPCLSGARWKSSWRHGCLRRWSRIVGATPIADALAEVCAGARIRGAPRDARRPRGTTPRVVIASHGGPEAQTIRSRAGCGCGLYRPGGQQDSRRGRSSIGARTVRGRAGPGAHPGRARRSARRPPRRSRCRSSRTSSADPGRRAAGRRHRARACRDRRSIRYAA